MTMETVSLQMKPLVLGIGNILKKDDGVGVYTANYLTEHYPDIAEHADIIDGGTTGFDLIEYMMHRGRVIVVDALLAESPPGSIYRFSPESLLNNGVVHSQHQVGLATIIDMMKVMGHDPDIEIIGIVPGDIESDEIGLSPPVASSVEKAAHLIHEMILNNTHGGV